ncbi:hypothetical protein ACHAW5_005530 [Stephanodiscus triporus]|uniref:Uncharacterized protein n=1 Tax=Stephanodiscus triporus TaxID=2934178 RepID=A0ABD3NKZ1_9STRA
MMAINRRERARLFARMFAPSSSSMSSPVPHRPPTDRGANVVVTVRCDDLRPSTSWGRTTTYSSSSTCRPSPSRADEASSSSSGSRAGRSGRLRTEGVRREGALRAPERGRGPDDDDDDDKNDSDAAGRGRRYRLDARVLPRHRIAFSNTSRGRVAFVRQLHGTELVIDHDGAKELERFGFRVLVYPVTREGGTGTGVTTTTTTTTARHSAFGKFLIP